MSFQKKKKTPIYCRKHLFTFYNYHMPNMLSFSEEIRKNVLLFPRLLSRAIFFFFLTSIVHLFVHVRVISGSFCCRLKGLRFEYFVNYFQSHLFYLICVYINVSSVTLKKKMFIFVTLKIS